MLIPVKAFLNPCQPLKLLSSYKRTQVNQMPLPREIKELREQQKVVAVLRIIFYQRATNLKLIRRGVSRLGIR